RGEREQDRALGRAAGRRGRLAPRPCRPGRRRARAVPYGGRKPRMDRPKSPPALIERFDTVAAEHPEATRRLTFGYPCLYVGGNMVTGLFGDAWHVRVGKDDAERLLELPGAAPFGPMPGRSMPGLTLLPEAIPEVDPPVRDSV